MNLVDVLGLDGRDVSWKDLGLCVNLPYDYFFETYETDPQTATSVDEMCAACPVREQCLMFGLENKEHGVWGGVYLDGRGGVDKARMSHKPQEVQDRIRAAL